MRGEDICIGVILLGLLLVIAYGFGWTTRDIQGETRELDFGRLKPRRKHFVKKKKGLTLYG